MLTLAWEGTVHFFALIGQIDYRPSKGRTWKANLIILDYT